MNNLSPNTSPDPSSKPASNRSVASTELLRLEAVHKRFTDAGSVVQVLQDLNFSLAAGEFVSIRGVSGSGKSTLLHIMGLLDLPTEGRVIFDGQDLSRIEDKKLSRVRNREIGFVFQFHHLMPDFTTLENVMMPKWIEGTQSGTGIMERARELLHKVGLEHRLKHLPGELSGGERQRAALARALMQNPRVVLADEPTGNLDTENSRGILSILEKLHSDLGVAIVLVTHDEGLFNVASRRYHLHEGKLREES